MNVPCMYILLDKILPWVYFIAYYYGFKDRFTNDKNPKNHESYVITCTS